MTVEEIHNILKSTKELSFEDHNQTVAIFLSGEDIKTKEQLENYIKENNISMELWWSRRIKVNDVTYCIYESWEVEDEIANAVDSEYIRIKNTLGDKFEYFDFDQYIEDNPISVEEVLECDTYRIVYSNNDEYYIAQC